MEDDHPTKDATSRRLVRITLIKIRQFRPGHLKGERLKNTQEFEKHGKRWSHGDENHVSKCWDDPPIICGDHTWRIVPVCKWLITMVIVSPLTRDSFPFQMGDLHGLQMGVILTTYIHWDDPPSRNSYSRFGRIAPFHIRRFQLPIVAEALVLAERQSWRREKTNPTRWTPY